MKNKNFFILDYALILKCAELCILSYKEKEDMDCIKEKCKELGFNFLFFVEKDNAEAIIAEDEENYYIAIAGTELNEIKDVIADLKFKKTKTKEGFVHEGMYEYYNKIAFKILKNILSLIKEKPKNIIFTGHSLGGSMAVLAASNFTDRNIKTSVVTFGQPKVGDYEFCQYYKNKLNYARIVIKDDIITKLPPSIMGYSHFGFKIILDTSPPLSETSLLEYIKDKGKYYLLDTIVSLITNINYFIRISIWFSISMIRNHKMSSYLEEIKKKENIIAFLTENESK